MSRIDNLIKHWCQLNSNEPALMALLLVFTAHLRKMISVVSEFPQSVDHLYDLIDISDSEVGITLQFVWYTTDLVDPSR